jgi:hypothetical protein
VKGDVSKVGEKILSLFWLEQIQTPIYFSVPLKDSSECNYKHTKVPRFKFKRLINFYEKVSEDTYIEY